jgi:APA family basic amino acid/polyamine antiporter
MLVVGNTIGVGVFTTTGVIAEYLPSPGLILFVWILGGILSLAGALAWAELGAAFPRAGGEYVYLRETFGPVWGFLSGWAAFLAGFSGSIAVLAIALADYFAGFMVAIPSGSVLWEGQWKHMSFQLSYGQMWGILLVWVFSLLNYCGLRLGSVTQNILSCSKLIAIAILIGAGFYSGKGRWTHFSPFLTTAGVDNLVNKVGVALIPVMFAYTGWNAVAYIASEVRKPEVTLPRALVLGTGITIAVYLALNVLYLYAASPSVLSGVVAIGETAARALFQAPAARGVSALIALSIAGVLNAMILTSGRIYFAMARDGVFFARAATLHPRFHTPGYALLLQALWTSVLIISGTFEQLLTYTTVVLVLVSACAVVTVFVLRQRAPDLPRPYRTWGYPWLPGLYVLGSTGILLNALWQQPVECLLGIGLCISGLPAYWWWRRVDSSRPAA